MKKMPYSCSSSAVVRFQLCSRDDVGMLDWRKGFLKDLSPEQANPFRIWTPHSPNQMLNIEIVFYNFKTTIVSKLNNRHLPKLNNRIIV